MTAKEKAVIAAALKWWESKRPQTFRVVDHIEFPLIHTITDSEARLAFVVAELVQVRRKL